MKPLRWSFLDRKQTRRLGDEVGEATRKPWGRRARPGGRHAPTLWAPRSSPDLVPSPIYTLIPWKHLGEPWNHFSTTATVCTHEIPSRGLFRHPAGGGFIHGWLLYQHHCLSDEAWVVYHRPSNIIKEPFAMNEILDFLPRSLIIDKTK